ncbi:MAG TPA: carboxypeptidase regulatory-like domain-containing protein [Pyrinomonadaceae bacterium]|nr:carboxypeptidase regulatory-like domain-containing protein [Pyrinomonadaceae bacterium]
MSSCLRLTTRLLIALQLLSSPAFAAPGPAAQQTYAITGRIKRAGTPNSIAGVTVTLRTRAGAFVKAAKTGADGTYSLAGVPAGGAYVLTPSLAGHTFSPPTRSYTNLSASQSKQGFDGVRHFYSITGHVADGAGGVGGVLVRVYGKVVAVTDDLGDFSLSGLGGGRAYTLALSKPGFVIEPARLTTAPLGGDLSLNFAARPRLRGRVTDASGGGLFGINMTFDGPQAGATTTGRDGSYSFLAGARGTYTVTPSKEQGFYVFTPGSQQVTAGDGSLAANFTADLDTASAPSYVLEFDGRPKTVDYRTFWRWRVPLPHFFWEFWAMPAGAAGGTYLLSDGYGGNHALLFGFANIGASERGRYQLFGNIWDGSLRTSFRSDEGPAPFEWGHFAVGWDGSHVVTYFNGVPVGRTEFRGPRISPGPGAGSSRLLVGGSDHSNLRGRIAQVRGYEGSNPRAVGSVYAAFRPETVFGVGGNLLSYYFRQAGIVADMSPVGHDGTPHPGHLRGTGRGILRTCAECPPPKFVLDPTAPNFADPANPGQLAAPVDAPPPAPAGALVFDSFSRRNATYALGGRGGLAETEGGEAGLLPWQTDVAAEESQPFGILNGRAVALANGRAVAWVGGLPGGGDLDVRVSRRPMPSGSGHNTGLSFRVQDAHNFFFAHTSEGATPDAPKTLTVGYYVGGERAELATGVGMPAEWTTLRVVTRAAGTISVFADDTPVYAAIWVGLSTADGAGLYNDAPGLGLTNRWDNFMVLHAPPLV